MSAILCFSVMFLLVALITAVGNNEKNNRRYIFRNVFFSFRIREFSFMW